MEWTLQASFLRLIRRGGWDPSVPWAALISFPKAIDGTCLTTMLRRGERISSIRPRLPASKGVVLYRCSGHVIVNFWTVYKDHLEPDAMAILSPDLSRVEKCTLNCFSERVLLVGGHAEAVLALKCDALANFSWDPYFDILCDQIALEFP